MPPSLFYGTGIGAALLVINKKDAHLRKHVLFINADREYKEGKNQNKLRPEDSEKITYVYHHGEEVPGYSRRVPHAELEGESWNCNVRRYVDNSPPAEPHDVQAHLQGGIPLHEVDTLAPMFAPYTGLRDELFRQLRTGYLSFAPAIRDREFIKQTFAASEGVSTAHGAYTGWLKDWWAAILPRLEQLQGVQSIYPLYQEFAASFVVALQQASAERGAILDAHQMRGALATYWDALATDLKSVAASGWNAELIPEDEILNSQHPAVVKELRDATARRDELEALFKEVAELEEGMWNEDDYPVWPKDALKELQAGLKDSKSSTKEYSNEAKLLTKRIKALEKLPQLNGHTAEYESLMAQREALIGDLEALQEQTALNISRFATHKALEDELKDCRRIIREIRDRKDTLVASARNAISDDEARHLILARWQRLLHSTVNSYLKAHSRSLMSYAENLWDKYTTPLHRILSGRDEAAARLDNFLMELGYE